MVLTQVLLCFLLAVISHKVNMAARLMMHYLDKVTCDSDTFHHSKLHKSNFTVMEKREMKGLVNVGTVREFTETINHEDNVEYLCIHKYDNPLIGRESQMKRFIDLLQLILSNDCNPDTQPLVIVFEGEAGIGKTRMLKAARAKALDCGIKSVCN